MWNKIQQMSRQSRLTAIILILISLPFDLNIIWSITRAGWLYWGSRFIGDLEQLIAGVLLVVFRRTLQRWFETKVDNRVAVLLIILGIYFLRIGSESIYFLTKRWFEECINIMECLKYY